jgi:O-antigen ligase
VAMDRRLTMLTPGRVWASTYELRLYPWLVAENMISDYPILGIGPGRFYQSFPQYRPDIDPGPLWRRYAHENAHNYYLQVAAEMGLVGLLMLLAFIAWTLCRANWRDPIAGAAGLAFLAVAVVSLLQHPLLEEPLFFGFLAVAALVPAVGEKAPSIRWPASQRRPIFALAAGLLALLAVVHVVQAWGKIPGNLESGIYGIEKADREFRWTSGLAVIKRENLAEQLALEFKAHNPDVSTHPLTVTVEQDGERLAGLELDDHDWHPVTVQLHGDKAIAIRVSRTFRPPGEVRELGVAVSGLP